MSAASRSPAITQEHALLVAARDGGEEAFRRLVEPYRSELHAHCYRMLGSVHDAEDALQEALLRTWRGLARFEGRSSLRSWLYTIATNACLSMIARRPRRVLPIDHGPRTDPHRGPGEPLAETVWLEPYPDEAIEDGRAAPEASFERRESVELAFIAAVQHLPATQRAVLILREVLGFSAREVAESLDTSVPAVNSALQRARKAVDDRLPAHSQQATLRSLGDARLRAVVEGYVDAMQDNDVDRVVAMLTEDVAWSMPPLASWFGGRDEVAVFLARGPLSRQWRWRRLPTRASGQPAVGAYVFDASEQAHLPFALDVLTLEGERISAVTAFITRALPGTADRAAFARWPDDPVDPPRVTAIFERFGLPARLS